MRIPDIIKYKVLSFHPTLIDYLKLCEINISELDNDLKVVTKKLTEEESYGIRNIHDRIHFILSSSINFIYFLALDKKKIGLSKKNNILKLVRILVRYFNNTDLARFKENYIVEHNINIDANKVIKEEHFSVAERNAFLNFSKIKNMSEDTKKQKVEFTPKLILEYKRRILEYSKKRIFESLIDSSEDLNSEDCELFNLLAVEINEQIYNILDKNFSDDGNEITNLGQLCLNLRNFIFYYLELKEKYSKSNNKLYDLINQEIVIQLYRHSNRNDFSKETKIIRYTFGLLMIMSFYLELSQNITISLRKWLNYLISKKYF